MRKILFFFGLIPFMGCSNGHVYRTIYGKVDIDTIDDKWPDNNNYYCYRVKVIGDDTIYFKPYDKTYYIASPTQDKQPNVVVKWNPETGEMTSNW